MAGKTHTHDAPEGADWMSYVDVAVWVAIAVVVILGAEYLFGFVVRERLAAQATKWNIKAAARPADAPIDPK